MPIAALAPSGRGRPAFGPLLVATPAAPARAFLMIRWFARCCVALLKGSTAANPSYTARPSNPKKLYKEGTVVKDILSNIKLNIKEEIGSHKPMPEKLKDKENRYPLYPVGPPLSMTGLWYNLMQSELKYNGFFYEDCPGQFQRRNNADSSDENEALFNPFGP